MGKIPKPCATLARRLLLLGVGMGVNMSANAADFCVANTAEFQTALTTAQSNSVDDSVQIVQGIYIGNFVYASTQSDNVTIDGGYTANCSARVADPVNTVLDGNNLDTVLIVVSQGTADVAIDSVTIQNGLSQPGPTNADGGGLHVDSSGLLTVTNNVFMNNSTPPNLRSSIPKGGAVFARGDVVLDNNVFERNSAEWAGAVYVTGDAVINNNVFDSNVGGGGAIFIIGTSTLVDNSFYLNIWR